MRASICKQMRNVLFRSYSFSDSFSFIKSFSTTPLLTSSTEGSSNNSNSGWKEEIISTEKVKINFVTKEQEIVQAEGFVGENVMRVSLRYDVGEGGSCEGQLCCTTCHVYVDNEIFDHIEPPSFREEDMLDAAPFLKDNSRLSCQIRLTKDMEGATFTLPFGTINMAVDKPSKKQNH